MKPNGRNIAVTEANKREYVQLACQMKMTRSIQVQIKSFLEGFYEVIPKGLISIFNEQELELLISGLPSIDIDDLKSNTEYRKYTDNSLQVGCRCWSSLIAVPFLHPQVFNFFCICARCISVCVCVCVCALSTVSGRCGSIRILGKGA